MGILQRVAVCYYAVALMEIFLPRATQFNVSSDKGTLVGSVSRAGALLSRYVHSLIPLVCEEMYLVLCVQ